MILDAISFLGTDHERKGPVASVIAMIERKLGVKVVYDARDVPFGRMDLVEAARIAQKLEESGIIDGLGRTPTLPDMPRLLTWYVSGAALGQQRAGGASLESDAKALFPGLAEALERSIWLRETDYFRGATVATERDIARRGPAILSSRFAGFSAGQRATDARLSLSPETEFLWIQADSLVSRRKVFVPAQTVIGSGHLLEQTKCEPLIREHISTGLATWPTRDGARLSGALEVIERDAFMIVWLNQLTLPRIALAQLRERSVSLSTFIDTCSRYRLRLHVVRLLTDAPAHVVLTVLEDESGHAPRFSIGLSAHRLLHTAAEKAATEALRMHTNCRMNLQKDGPWDPNQSPERILHAERIRYWATPEHVPGLEFLIAGPESAPTREAWEEDTPEQHLSRIVEWCRGNEYECAAVGLGHSKKNPTPWHIEMVIIPELQPLWVTESHRGLGGERLASIPARFGFSPRSDPFVGAPHPFA